uniref:Myb/SANT-like DNA-binding domain-containing protein n=1 Tax=Knipowitschia caucasica TaxID=637954 RepID=A0AAV2MK46_KNICA
MAANMGRTKQYWSVAETICLLEIWSSSETKNQHKGATRTKEQYEQIQRELAAQGHDRAVEQIVNKIKKLKMEFKEQKYHSKQNRDYWVQKNPYFEVLECVFGGGEEQASQLEDYNCLPQSSADNEKWSVQETDCLLKICTDAEFHQRLLFLRSSKEIIEDIQKEMNAQGHELTSERILDQLQTLQREHRAQNEEDQDPGNSLCSKIDLNVVDFILGDKEECTLQTTETIKTEPPEDFEEIAPELDAVKMEPLENNSSVMCSSEAPECSSYRPAQKMNGDKWIDAEVQALLSGEGKWYDILDSILGHHPLYSGTTTTAAAAHLSENSAEEFMESIENHPLSRDCFENQVESGPGDHEVIQVLEIVPNPDSKTVVQQPVDDDVVDCTSYSSSPQQRPQFKINNEKWMDAEVQALLSIYADTKNQTDFEGKWYDILDSILGHHPMYSGTTAAAHLSENSVEEFMESTENNTPSREGLTPNCTENNVESIGSSEGPDAQLLVLSDSAPELEKSPGPFSSTEQSRPVSSSSFHPAVRTLAFHSRPVKRKRRESSELVECLERMQERFLQHSREMHEALLNNIDTHMTAVVGLMERMASAMEARAANPH